MRVTSLSWVVVFAALAACSKAEDGSNGSVGVYSLFDPVAINPSLCASPAIPYPNNALFADATSATGVTKDTTLNIPSTASSAVAANLTDGFSTTASILTDVLGSVDYSTVANSLVIIEADATPRVLVAGVDYTIQASPAMALVSGTGGACAANPLPAKFLPISQQRSRILIEPLKPLAPSTTYIVAVTKKLLSTDGVPATPGELFPVVNSDTKICRLSGAESTSELLCTDSGAPAAAAAISAVLAQMSAVQLITLESLRRNLVRPTVLGMRSLLGAIGAPAVNDSDLVIAWSFTTQTVGATLQTLNALATAKTFTVGAVPNAGAGDLDANGRLGTGELGVAGIPNSADIYVGTINSVPYYLKHPASTTDFASQLDYWHSNGVATTGAGGVFPAILFDNDANPATPPVPAPCSGAPFNFVASDSTTNCFRIPTQRSAENLPIMITVPKTAKPAGGWPVVIFQHGITGNRAQMIPLGATLAGAGFVTVSIDLPLHGISSTDTFAAFRQAGNERTFDLDISAGSSCLSAPSGDGTTDPSGTCFINLASLPTSRDNLRQAVSDLINVAKSLPSLDLDGGGADIDSTKIYFAGISLGSIVGTTFLAVNSDVKAAALSVPGGGVSRLLDASKSFGPIIAAGLSGAAFSGAGLSGPNAPFEGTDTYETFIRFAQHLVDPGDPINYATAANAGHSLLMHEVIGDTVVPNSALTTCPAPSALPLGIGATAATNSLADTRLAACLAGGELVGSNATTKAACYAGVDKVGVCAGSASQDATLISGYLSGTEPLFGEMGLDVVGPITPGASSGTTCANQTDAGGLHEVVQFAIGTHGSLLTPAGTGGPTQFLPVTVEMQREMATFFASNGLTLASGSCP